MAHLRSLAAMGGRQPFRREAVPDTLRRLVESLPEPAYLTGQRWDILAWNDAATALFGDFDRLAPEYRNILHWMLTDPAARRLFSESWVAEAQRMVSLFRVAHDLWPGDAAFADLVERCARAARRSPAGGRRTTSASRFRVPKTCSTPRAALCATTMQASRPTMTRPSSSPSTRDVEATGYSTRRVTSLGVS